MEWFSIKHKLPEVEWSDPDEEGKRYWSPQLVLLLRKLEFRGGSRSVISTGEYDTTGVPAVWRIWYEFVNDRGYEDVEGHIINDVTHWMPLPEPPNE